MSWDAEVKASQVAYRAAGGITAVEPPYSTIYLKYIENNLPRIGQNVENVGGIKEIRIHSEDIHLLFLDENGRSSYELNAFLEKYVLMGREWKIKL
jgi:hypothetical protein